MSVDVLVRYQAVKYWRRKDRVAKKVCKDLDHARNYVKVITKPDWYKSHDGSWKNMNDISKVTVWLDDNHCAVWLKGKGWGPITEKQRRRG